MDKPMIYLRIASRSFTPRQYNNIVKFVSEFILANGTNSLSVTCDNLPLFLCGKISELSPNARLMFDDWSSKGVMRNMSLVKTEEKL